MCQNCLPFVLYIFVDLCYDSSIISPCNFAKRGKFIQNIEEYTNQICTKFALGTLCPSYSYSVFINLLQLQFCKIISMILFHQFVACIYCNTWHTFESTRLIEFMCNDSNNKFNKRILNGVNCHSSFVPLSTCVLLNNLLGFTSQGLELIQGRISNYPRNDSLHDLGRNIFQPQTTIMNST